MHIFHYKLPKAGPKTRPRDLLLARKLELGSRTYICPKWVTKRVPDSSSKSYRLVGEWSPIRVRILRRNLSKADPKVRPGVLLQVLSSGQEVKSEFHASFAFKTVRSGSQKRVPDPSYSSRRLVGKSSPFPVRAYLKAGQKKSQNTSPGVLLQYQIPEHEKAIPSERNVPRPEVMRAQLAMPFSGW